MNWYGLGQAEKDALIATVVMGWTQISRRETRRSAEAELEGVDPKLARAEGTESPESRARKVPLKRYSTRIEDAWEVVERLQHLDFALFQRGGVWRASFGGITGEHLFAAEAICMAAARVRMEPAWEEQALSAVGAQ